MKKLWIFIQHAYARLLAHTPTFWKSTQRKFLRLGAMFIVIGTAYANAPTGVLPDWILTVITYAGFTCGVVVAVAQFACEDPKDVKHGDQI